MDNNKVEKDHLGEVKVGNHQKAKNVILDSELRAEKSSEKWVKSRELSQIF